MSGSVYSNCFSTFDTANDKILLGSPSRIHEASRITQKYDDTGDVEFIVSYVHVTTIVFERGAIPSYLMYVIEMREDVRRAFSWVENRSAGAA